MPPNIIATTCTTTPPPPEWWSGVWSTLCLLLSWVWSGIVWCFANQPDDDYTFLGVIFALNASFASVDLITNSYMESMRAKFRRRIAKYKNPEWINSIKNDGSPASINKREQLAKMAERVLEIENEIPVLFTKKAKVWKVVMGICAAITLICMVVPYKGRILVLLALPVIVFIKLCSSEACAFDKKTTSACQEIDTTYERMKEEKPKDPTTEGDSVLSRLSKIEDTLITLAKNSAQTNKRRKSRKKS